MNILITGGAGFIGSHLSKILLYKGHNITVLDNLSTGRFANIKELTKLSNFSFVFDTMFNKIQLKKLVQKSDIIFHLAAAVGVAHVIDNPVDSLILNINSTSFLFEAAKETKPLIILASSSEIYGKNIQLPFNENDDRLIGTTFNGRWGYAESKSITEYLAYNYFRVYNIPTIICRLFNTIGFNQIGSYGMVVPRFINAALKNQKIKIFGSGKQTRCFIYIDDMIDIFIKLMSEKNAIGNIFNIGSNEEISILELAELIIKLTNSKSKINYVSYEKAYGDKFEDMQRRVPDISKIKSLFPEIKVTSLKSALEKIIEYYKTEGI